MVQGGKQYEDVVFRSMFSLHSGQQAESSPNLDFLMPLHPLRHELQLALCPLWDQC